MTKARDSRVYCKPTMGPLSFQKQVVQIGSKQWWETYLLLGSEVNASSGPAELIQFVTQCLILDLLSSTQYHFGRPSFKQHHDQRQTCRTCSHKLILKESKKLTSWKVLPGRVDWNVRKGGRVFWHLFWPHKRQFEVPERKRSYWSPTYLITHLHWGWAVLERKGQIQFDQTCITEPFHTICTYEPALTSAFVN